MTNWDLFQVSKTESTFKNKFTSHQQTKEEKSDNHIKLTEKAFGKNRTPNQKRSAREFPGRPAVRTPCFLARELLGWCKSNSGFCTAEFCSLILEYIIK